MFVRLWMSTPPVTVTAGKPLSAAINLMAANQIRRIIVVDQDENMVGIISKQDLAAIMPSTLDGSSAGSPHQLADSTRVEEIMTAHPVATDPMTPMEQVARTMRTHKIGGLPVTEAGKLVGIITESDIFRAFVEMFGPEDDSVRLELVLGKDSRDFYTVMDIFKRYGMIIQAITIHHNFGENQRLLTVRLMGEEISFMLDALRKSTVQINRIQGEEEL